MKLSLKRKASHAEKPHLKARLIADGLQASKVASVSVCRQEPDLESSPKPLAERLAKLAQAGGTISNIPMEPKTSGSDLMNSPPVKDVSEVVVSESPGVIVVSPGTPAKKLLASSQASQAPSETQANLQPKLNGYDSIDGPLTECPLCGVKFTDQEDISAREAHLNSHYVGEATAPPRSPGICPVCGKLLSHLTEERKSQHINRCLDEPNNGVGKVAAGSESAKSDERCPMCRKLLPSKQSSRIAHLKRCATQNSVSAAQLITLISGQQEHVEVTDAWVPPTSERESPVESDSQEFHPNPGNRRSNTQRPRSRGGKTKIKSQDEQLHLALALSASMSDNAVVSKPKKRLSKQEKELRKPLPQLVTTSEDEVKSLVESNLAKVIESAKNMRDAGEPAIGESTPLQDRSSLKPSLLSDGCDRPVWELLSCRHDSVSKVYTIPGVIVSPDKKRTQEIFSTSGELSKNSPVRQSASNTPGSNKILDEQGVTQSSPVDIIESFWCDSESVYECQESQSAFSSHMELLLDSHEGSDIHLTGKDGFVYAHSLIMRARCCESTGELMAPLKLKDWINSPTNPLVIDFPTSRESILVVARYIYTGHTRFKRSLAQEVELVATESGQHILVGKAREALSTNLKLRSESPHSAQAKIATWDDLSDVNLDDIALSQAQSQPVQQKSNSPPKKRKSRSQSVEINKQDSHGMSGSNKESDVDAGILSRRILQTLKHDEQTYAQILYFVPLDIHKLLKLLKDHGIKCKQNELVEILNEQSITYVDKTGNKNRTKKKASRAKARSKSTK